MDCGRPVTSAYLTAKDCAMPINRPLSRITGNDRNEARRATTSVGITSSVRFVTSRPVSGITKMPARPARAPPNDQLTSASRSGDQPSEAVLRSLCATAELASPVSVCVDSRCNTPVITAAIRSSQSRSCENTMPSIWIDDEGRLDDTYSELSPKRSVAPARSRDSSPSVAIIPTRGDACRSRRRMSQ